ncbi:MAG TPA: AMIN domain-containing protein [Haliangiales bacterium]|nr:AMIN domain-containing protein [Haliangiales bacterium]
MRQTALALVILGLATPVRADYAGVTPGRPPPKKNEGPKSTLTWVGFQAEGAGEKKSPRVFLQLSSPGTFDQKVKGRDVVIALPGFHVDVKNNTRPLKTEDFGTDVVRINAKPTKTGVEVHVRFRGAARPAKIRAADESDGWSYLYLDF